MRLRNHSTMLTVVFVAPMVVPLGLNGAIAKPLEEEASAERIENPIAVEVFALLEGPWSSMTEHPAVATALSELRSRAARTGRFDVQRYPHAKRIWGNTVDRSSERPPHALVVELQYLTVGTLKETVSLLAPDARSRLGPIINKQDERLFVNCGAEIEFVERNADGSSRIVCAGLSYIILSFPEHDCDLEGIQDCLLGAKPTATEPADRASNATRASATPAGLCGGKFLHFAVTETVNGAVVDLLACLDGQLDCSGLGSLRYATKHKTECRCPREVDPCCEQSDGK